MRDVPSALSAALSSRYRLERELGVGGMATVYLARDLKHDRDVAIKVLRTDVAAAVGVDRFLAEIKTTGHLKHPHILPLFDSGSADAVPFYVMPFVDGESLRARLRRTGRLPIAEVVRILHSTKPTTAIAIRPSGRCRPLAGRPGCWSASTIRRAAPRGANSRPMDSGSVSPSRATRATSG
jgi:Protein kinase domain